MGKYEVTLLGNEQDGRGFAVFCMVLHLGLLVSGRCAIMERKKCVLIRNAGAPDAKALAAAPEADEIVFPIPSCRKLCYCAEFFNSIGC